jgi:hypothetical protein
VPDVAERGEWVLVQPEPTLLHAGRCCEHVDAMNRSAGLPGWFASVTFDEVDTTTFLLLMALCGGVFVALAVSLVAYVIRRELRRRTQLAAVAHRLGLAYQRHADPWSIAGPEADVDEAVYGWLDGVPVALMTLGRWVGAGAYDEPSRSRHSWSFAAVPVAEGVDLAVLSSHADFPVRLDVRRGWLLIATQHQGVRLTHSPATAPTAERLLRLAARFGRLVPLRQPVPSARS